MSRMSRSSSWSKDVDDGLRSGLWSGRGLTSKSGRDRGPALLQRSRHTRRARTATRRPGYRGTTFGSDLQREAGLADSGGTGQGDRTAELLERPRDAFEVAFASDERRHLRSGRFPGYASSDRNGANLTGSSGCTTWNTRSGRVEVTQALLTEIHQADRFAQRLADELLGRQRNEHLAAVRHCHQPCGTVDRRARSSPRRAGSADPVCTATCRFHSAGRSRPNRRRAGSTARVRSPRALTRRSPALGLGALHSSRCRCRRRCSTP